VKQEKNENKEKKETINTGQKTSGNKTKYYKR